MSTGKNPYLSVVLGQMSRLLAQQDRNPFSSTYGCFDWNYWHDKITGFPNGHAQESMLVLSLLHEINDEKNIYYNNEQVIVRIVVFGELVVDEKRTGVPVGAYVDIKIEP